MDDEHEDDDGIDAARSGCRNEDSGDGTCGIQVADSGEIGHGTPDGGVEQGRPDSSRVDGTGEGVQQVALQWRSAPLPTVDEFAGYERIQPGAADRIITMAEKSLDAEIEAQRTSNEVAAKDHKAQNICMIIATTAYSILPIIGFGSAIVCVALGQSVAAAFGALIGAVTAGPQIIQEIRKKEVTAIPRRSRYAGDRGICCYSFLFLRGRPPPTPRPGRLAFHRSMVSGSQPRVRPIVASGWGSL